MGAAEEVIERAIDMERFRPRAQGRGFRILKRSSHITVAVSADKNVSKSISRAPQSAQTRSPKRSEKSPLAAKGASN